MSIFGILIVEQIWLYVQDTTWTWYYAINEQYYGKFYVNDSGETKNLEIFWKYSVWQAGTDLSTVYVTVHCLLLF